MSKKHTILVSDIVRKIFRKLNLTNDNNIPKNGKIHDCIRYYCDGTDISYGYIALVLGIKPQYD